MCCFSRPVNYVRNTNIFARFVETGQQAIVYGMNVSADESLAMILPIPVPQDVEEDAVKFVSLKDYDRFFRDMAKGFPPTKSLLRATTGDVSQRATTKLEVVEVGNFVASFVPTVNDFPRLDERFRLPDGTWDQLPIYKDYGFTVFQLKQGRHRGHPMAFRFPSAQPTRLFFPTVHIHDGKVHTTAKFDHILYRQNTAGVAPWTIGWRESPQPAGMFMDEKKAAGLIDPAEHCYKRVIRGRQKNIDVWV